MTTAETDSYCTFTQASLIRVGSYVMIDDHPCVCKETTHSKTGKHGSAKCHITGLDIFDQSKHEQIFKATDNIRVPIVTKEDYQVCDIKEDDDFLSLVNASGDLREDVRLLDKDLKTGMLKSFLVGKQLNCTVMTAMGKSVINAYKIEK